MDLKTILVVFVTAVVFYLIGKLAAERNVHDRLRDARSDAAKRSRAVIGGQFSEQLAPFLPGFRYRPTEVKFLGKPSDFIVFEGLDERNIKRVVFLEVKSGKGRLSETELSLRKAIESGNVGFEIYTVPSALTTAD